MKIIKIFFINIILIVIVISISELIYGHLQPGLQLSPIVSPTENHLGDFLPNQSSTYNNNSKVKFKATINKDGYRDNLFNTDCKDDIYFIGDSITFGWGVNQGETVADYYQYYSKKNNKCINSINLGVPFYSAADELLLLESKLKLFKKNSDIVLIIYTGNDFSAINEEAIFRERHHGNILENNLLLRYFIRLKLGYYIYQTYIVPNKKLNEFLFNINYSYIDNERCTERGAIYTSCREGKKEIDGKKLEKNPMEYPDIFSKYNTILKDISLFAKKNNIIIYYYVISSYDNFPNVDNYIKNLYNSNDLKYIGSFSKFHLNTNSINSLYIPADGHLSKSGNEKVAYEIYNYINEK